MTEKTEYIREFKETAEKEIDELKISQYIVANIPNGSGVLRSKNYKITFYISTNNETPETDSANHLYEKFRDSEVEFKKIESNILSETSEDNVLDHIIQQTKLPRIDNSITSSQSDNSNNEKIKTSSVQNSDICSPIKNDQIEDKIQNHTINDVSIKDIEEELEEVMRIIQDSSKANKLKRFIQQLKMKESYLDSLIRNTQTVRLSSNNNSEKLVSEKLVFNQSTSELKDLISEILGENKAEEKDQNQNLLSKIQFAFVYSAPMVILVKDLNQKIIKKPIPFEVEYRSEYEILKKIFLSTNKDIKVCSYAASLSGFTECLNNRPKCLHFCGHGMKNNKENFGLMTRREEGDFLLFEDSEGIADFISCFQLKNFLLEKRFNNVLDFVFVASCHSYLIGEVFREAGAKHVICVARNEKILDFACLEFTKYFYQAYFSGSYNVCEAFKFAKNHLKTNKCIPPGEENKFILLINESIYQTHNCESFNNIEEGTLHDSTFVPKYHSIPASVENFIGRQIDMHEILSIIHKNRLVTVKGIHGIGKSSTTKQVAHYLIERNLFVDGIIFLQMYGCSTIESFLSDLDNYFRNGKNQNEEIDFERILQRGNETFAEGLMILDNIDLILDRSREKFKDVIYRFLLGIPKLKIILTSRTSLGMSVKDISEKIYQLNPLNSREALELFFSRSPREIKEEEIKNLLRYELSTSETDFAYLNQQFLDELRFHNENTNSNSTNSLCEKLKIFESHHLMQLLCGHPHAISFTAGLLSERTLTDVYKMLLAKPLGLLKDENLEDQDDQTMSSLGIHLESTLNQIESKSKESITLFGLLGLLPGGILGEDLNILFGKRWYESSRILLNYSLILKHETKYGERYGLFPFMIKYAENKLSERNKSSYQKNIVIFLISKARSYYSMISNIGSKNLDILDTIQREESNIRACLKRELEHNNTLDNDKSSSSNENKLKTNIDILKKVNFTVELISKKSTEKNENPAGSKDRFEGSIIVEEKAFSNFEKLKLSKSNLKIDDILHKSYLKPSKFSEKKSDSSEENLDKQLIDEDSAQINSELRLSLNFAEKDEILKRPAIHLNLYYCLILFLLKRYEECNKMIRRGLKLCLLYKDRVAEANLIKLKGCTCYMKKEYKEAYDNFFDSNKIFKEINCPFGVAITDAAIGYIKTCLLEESSISYIKRLESSLGFYQKMGHNFGVYFTSKWCSNVMSKFKKYQNQSSDYQKLSKSTLSTLKRERTFGYKHSHGFFLLKMEGDPCSLFIETALEIDKTNPDSMMESHIDDLKKFDTSKLFSQNDPKKSPLFIKNELADLRTPEIEKGTDSESSKTKIKFLGRLPSKVIDINDIVN